MKVLVMVLDGFGVGAMADCLPSEAGANTAKSVLSANADLKIPNLLNLGLGNILNEPSLAQPSKSAIFGKAKLKHYGADSFAGHQEIMGTKPAKPTEQPFFKVIDKVYAGLVAAGIKVEKIYAKDLIGSSNARLAFLKIADKAIFADNMESMPGSVYNLTCSLDLMSFAEIKELAGILRKMVEIPRIIAFGGENVSMQNILNAAFESGDYFGINAPKSGVYKQNYQVIHLGYGIDHTTQLPYFLHKEGIPVIFTGKVADIVYNEDGVNIPGVDTREILEYTLQQWKSIDRGFICANIQETDLAGHSENAVLFGEKLEIVDSYLAKFIDSMGAGDMLIIMADHGNDPKVSNQHTREYVPLLIKVGAAESRLINIGTRETMSDVAKTVMEYFGLQGNLAGESFLPLIMSS
ncbi:MAG: phosphopentomutase [Alphaproteobacteria bacterium]|jgi:phosphopentomutase|nr:phosphopentomutase [Alphaproteobacteria bacterium]